MQNSNSIDAGDLPYLAKAVCRGGGSSVDLSHLGGIDAASVAALNTWVERVSDKLYSVRLCDDTPAGAGTVRCRRIERSGQEREFILAATENPVRFTS